MKEVISSKPVLKLANFEKPFQVTTDASNKVVGGVLQYIEYAGYSPLHMSMESVSLGDQVPGEYR